MKVKVAKWGNSLAVRVPKHVADELGLAPGQTVDLQRQGNQLRIETVRAPKHPPLPSRRPAGADQARAEAAAVRRLVGDRAVVARRRLERRGAHRRGMGGREAGGGGEEWQTTPPRLTPVIFFGSISGSRLGTNKAVAGRPWF